MFILDVTYTRPMEAVELHVATHMDWVREGYERGMFLASGRKVPRTGGIILATGTREDIDSFLAKDPFVIHDVGTYTVTEIALTRTVDTSRHSPGPEQTHAGRIMTEPFRHKPWGNSTKTLLDRPFGDRSRQLDRTGRRTRPLSR